jgi:Asp-tRNA(Asn)/Glu-tRNA(Gln) amidotransferase A subunit family amidase
MDTRTARAPPPNRPLRVAVFNRHAAFDADPQVAAAIDHAARWLAEAGCEVQAVEPPYFEEGAQLWRRLVMDDMPLRPDAPPDCIRACMGDRVDANQTRAVVASLLGEPGVESQHDTNGWWGLLAELRSKQPDARASQGFTRRPSGHRDRAGL